jgi:hypothetical protein
MAKVVHTTAEKYVLSDINISGYRRNMKVLLRVLNAVFALVSLRKKSVNCGRN